MIPVDLSEMAEFIAVVQNRFVFLTCVSRCQLQFVGQNPVSKCEQMHAVSVEYCMSVLGVCQQNCQFNPVLG